MRGRLIKIWTLAIAAALLSLFLLFYAVRFLTSPNYPSDGWLLLIGIVCVLSGIFVATAQFFVPRRFEATAIIIALGFYFLARAVGIIDGSWFARILGLLCLAGAAMIGYVGFVAAGRIR